MEQRKGAETEKVLENRALFCYAMNVSAYNSDCASEQDSLGHDPIIKEKRKRYGRFNTVSKAWNYSGSKD